MYIHQNNGGEVYDKDLIYHIRAVHKSFISDLTWALGLRLIVYKKGDKCKKIALSFTLASWLQLFWHVMWMVRQCVCVSLNQMPLPPLFNQRGQGSEVKGQICYLVRSSDVRTASLSSKTQNINWWCSLPTTGCLLQMHYHGTQLSTSYIGISYDEWVKWRLHVVRVGEHSVAGQILVLKSHFRTWCYIMKPSQCGSI